MCIVFLYNETRQWSKYSPKKIRKTNIPSLQKKNLTTKKLIKNNQNKNTPSLTAF